MFLKSLELVGFKSFAKRTVLHFEAGITGVVGPNGSGKSNIADAIRWVMGAQSKKAVRGKIGSDVIFSGTRAKAAMSLAEVSLTFDNSGQLLPYDFDEVVVTRRLYRSGDSEYLVNGSKVRLADLQHAFAVAGIGAENYTVISQGMVDQVLSQSPTQRRSLFEEAAGVRQFYLRRDESRRKLNETSANLSRVEDVVGELEPRLKLLRRQASALAKREELEGKLRDAYRSQFGHRFRGLESEHRTAKEKQAELNREFMAMTKELEALSRAVDELRRSQQGLKLNELLEQRNALRDRREKLQEQLSQAVTAKEVARTSQAAQAEQEEHFASRLAELKSESVPKLKEAMPISIGDSNKLAAECAAGVEKLEQAISRGAGKTELTKLVKSLKELISRLQEAGSAEATRFRQAQLQRHEQEIAALTKQLESAKQRGAELAGTIETETKRSEELSADLGKLDKQLKRLDDEIATEQQQSFGEVDKLKQQESVLEEKRRAHEAYRNELGEVNLTLAKLETRLDDLKTEAKTKLGEAFPPQADEELPPPEAGSEEAIARLEKRLLEVGSIDPETAAEHQEVEERHAFLTKQSEDLRQAKADLERVIRQLEHKSQTLFKEAFTKINAEFGNYFQELFGGGKAELMLIEQQPENDDSENHAQGQTLGVEFGIDIKATPPGKRLQSLAMLSGGERALTSVALLFAILTVNPSPFVMLDEVDAALDEANTSRFADVLSKLADQTQFIVVTHNRDTMRAAAMLYGVTMDETGISTMLSLKLPEAEKVATHT